MKKMSLIYTSSVAHNPERATRIPAVTTFSSFILRYILKFFFPRTRELCPVHERIIRSRRYDKGKLNVILGLLVLLSGLWDLKDILSSRQNRSKNKLFCENAMTRDIEVARSVLWAPVYTEAPVSLLCKQSEPPLRGSFRCY